MGKKLKNGVYKEDDERVEDEDQDEDEDSSDDDDEDDEAEDVPQQKPRPNAVYNSAALHEKLEDIGWPDGLDWLQTLCVDYQVADGEIDVNDDLAREMAFYTQALDGTREAFTKLLLSGKPFLRPPDYYAEMVKSDSHMLKVKDALLSQQKKMEETEERRKAREAKRFSKEVQAQKLKQRAQEKKQNIESVKKWRKMRQDGGFSAGDGDELPGDLDSTRSLKKRKFDPSTRRPSKRFKGSEGRGVFSSPEPGSGRGDSVRAFGGKENGAGKRMSPFKDAEKGKQNARSPFGSAGKGSRNPAPWDRSGGKGRGNNPAKGKAFAKRQSRDAKYGHGGRKSFKKKNTAESSAGFFKGNRKKGKS
ncbi:hypothetical protein GOP47_0011029 [Adiantum capillus-veneris]|uniref:Uncharacterized protein n=1 Tax=Adiantum capillus-veneris TaxID=13818 RepID=A0A9D4ZGX8_ADICA|nr:hypothetical protein GOP47_0011029 [Adiantum capillus-veneris]